MRISKQLNFNVQAIVKFVYRCSVRIVLKNYTKMLSGIIMGEVVIEKNNKSTNIKLHNY